MVAVVMLANLIGCLDGYDKARSAALHAPLGIKPLVVHTMTDGKPGIRIHRGPGPAGKAPDLFEWSCGQHALRSLVI
jgi:hypothetical protein